MDERHVRAKITTLLVLLSLSGWAQANYDQAVEVYMKGFQACNKANTLRSSNLNAAKQQLAIYQQYLDRATAINGSILTSSAMDMDKNISYCNRVITNVGRAQATPVIQTAFKHCKAAKSLYNEKSFDQAKNQLQQYQRLRDQALSITSSLKDIYKISQKMRACGRLEKKIASYENQHNEQLKQIQQAANAATKLGKDCQAIASFTDPGKFTVEQLRQANNRFADWKKRKSRQAPSDDIMSQAMAMANDPAAKTLRQQVKKNRSCELEVTEHIRAMTQTQNSMQNTLQRSSKTLTTSLKECKQAKDLIARGQLDSASELYKDSASLKTRATDAETVALAKRYKWQVASNYNSLLSQTSSCHQQVAANIKALKAKRDKARAAKPVDTAKAAAERKRRAAAAAKRKADERAALAAEKRRREEAQRTARLEAEKRRKEAREQAEREAEARRARAEELARARAAEAEKQRAALAEKRRQRNAANNSDEARQSSSDVDDWDDALIDEEFSDEELANIDFEIDELDVEDEEDSKGPSRSWTDLIR